MSPEERTRRARIAAYSMHAQNDSCKTSKPGRDAFMARFEREVDPDCSLPVDERLRRAEAAKKAYFLRLAKKSTDARRRRKVAEQ